MFDVAMLQWFSFDSDHYPAFALFALDLHTIPPVFGLNCWKSGRYEKDTALVPFHRKDAYTSDNS